MEREPPLPWSISAATSTRNWIRIGWTREPGNFMRLLCFSSFRGKRSLSLPPPSFLAPSSLLPPFLPPSHSLALLPRLESHAYAATNVRGVNPRELPGLRSVAASLMIAPSRALPFCLARSLSLPPSPSPCFAISSLSSSVAPSPPENAFRDPKPRENARSFARLLLLAAVSPCRMADETFGFKKIYKRVRESNFSIESNHRRWCFFFFFLSMKYLYRYFILTKVNYLHVSFCIFLLFLISN